MLRSATDQHRRTRQRGKRAWLGVLCLAQVSALIWPVRALAHEGPPYPVFVDKQVGPYSASVWADPDVGTGTFFIMVEPAQDGARADESKVEVCVRPASGRLAEACYAARRDGVRNKVQYQVAVPFDAEELWRTRIILNGPRGVGEAATEVEVTAPGLGRWDLLLYLFPFAAVGLLWLRAVFSARRRATCLTR